MPFHWFQIRLARTLDEILDVLDRQPAFRRFVLDGQTVLLEDYLELRPNRKAQLERLIASGRLVVGPSYVLPDQYLTGGEAQIRNLLIGRQMAERFGASSAVGYAPDTFGHIAQLPQILRGFGIDTLIFWRGLGDEAEQLGSVFEWQGYDGSPVLAVRQLDSYGNAPRLGYLNVSNLHTNGSSGSPEAAVQWLERLAERTEKARRLAGLDDVLVCNGTDHDLIQADLPEILAACRQLMSGAEIEIASYDEYAAHVRKAVTVVGLHAGELCGARDGAVLRGVNSTRIYLKQANAAAERALFEAESVAALAAHVGASFPTEELRTGWKCLLQNHPHDSICGCSVDEVHDDMLPRYEKVRQIAARVRREALTYLAGEEARWSYREPVTPARSAINLMPWARTDWVEVPIPAHLRSARRLVATAAAPSEEADNVIVGAQRVSPETAIVVARVAGLSALNFELESGEAETKSSIRVTERTIENEFYRVEVASNGAVDILHKPTGRQFDGLGVLLDEADRGDEYTYCPVNDGEVVDQSGASPRIRLVAAGPVLAAIQVDWKLSLPTGLTNSRQRRKRQRRSCPVRTTIRLVAGVDRVEFETVLTNRVNDHRLRVLFPLTAKVDQAQAEGQFAILRRPAKPISRGEGWKEVPTGTHHMSGAVEADGLMLLARGLPEYEIVPFEQRSAIALTLLRSVGWLSRDDLETRSGHAGPHLPTPGAQCHASHQFEYALTITSRADAQRFDDDTFIRASHDYRYPVLLGPKNVRLPAGWSLDGTRFAISAIKVSEDGSATVIRVFNPTERPGWVVLGPALADATLARLDETFEGRPDGTVLDLPPGRIVTLRVPRAVSASTLISDETVRSGTANVGIEEFGAETRGDGIDLDGYQYDAVAVNPR